MVSSTVTYTKNYSSLPYVENVNTGASATYDNIDEYYNFVLINKEYDDKDYIYDLYEDSKSFKEEEFIAEEKIIKNNSIPLKENFKDYYE